jgi:hypothetical protein
MTYCLLSSANHNEKQTTQHTNNNKHPKQTLQIKNPQAPKTKQNKTKLQIKTHQAPKTKQTLQISKPTKHPMLMCEI